MDTTTKRVGVRSEVDWTFLPISACRHAARTGSSSNTSPHLGLSSEIPQIYWMLGVQSLRILLIAVRENLLLQRWFPADDLHRTDFH